MRMRTGLDRLAALALATGLLGGCAWVSTQNAISAERSLAAAGFQMKLATTPQQLASLEGLPQRKLLARDRDGAVIWIYADSMHCKCIWAGSQAAYGRYQQMQKREQIAEDEAVAAMNWGPWGPWGPWY
ncbi:MAG: hypothetical protein HRU00_10015 [Myxococcales bacterium]|nr:hypothetical protein [Myxococcales bacterium]